MDDLEKGNIDPTVEPNPNLLGLYSKCYAGLIMEGNDGNADFTIDDGQGKTDTRKGNGLLPGRIGLPYVQKCGGQWQCAFYQP